MNKTKIKLLTLLLFISFKAIYAENAKYIFFFIGDGMSMTHINLAQAALNDKKVRESFFVQSWKNTNGNLFIKQMPIAGIATTNAENRYITDSAAAATALATGHKTDVGRISQDHNNKNIMTIAEKAKKKGMKVGIITSVSIDHATPACFYAHTPNRNNYKIIGDQLLDSGFDYFAGGSVKWKDRAKTEKTSLSQAFYRYKKKAISKGFKYVTTKNEFNKLKSGEKHPIIATLNMLSEKQNIDDSSALPYTIDSHRLKGTENDINLADFTSKGIEILNNKKGFFMMIEGGKIDWACHANDAVTAIYETIAFDQALGKAIEFAKKHPKETLIVLTGDHDCGGLTLGFAGTNYDSAFELLAGQKQSFHEFTNEVEKRMKEGITFEKMLEYTCLKFGFTKRSSKTTNKKTLLTSELSDYEINLLKRAFYKSVKGDSKVKLSNRDIYNGGYGGYNPYVTTCTHILNNKAGIDFTSYCHTAVPVPVFAKGANDKLFVGYYDNTDIPKKIMKAANLK